MKYLTNSEMSTWRRCRRRWWLTYYRGLRRRGESDFNRPLGIGNRVHDALAAYYDPASGVDGAGLLAYVDAGVARDLAERPEHGESIEKEAALCRVMLEGYLDWLAETGEDQALTVVEAERARSAPVRAEGLPDTTLLAKLDARVSHDEYGSRLALEHKTVGSLKQHLPELRLNTQCLTEHLVEFLAELEEGAEPEEAKADGVLFNMLLKSKRTARATPPFYRRERVGHSMSELRNHWRHVVAVAGEIAWAESALDAGADHHLECPPSPDASCHWSCPFFRVCPNVDGDADHEEQLAREYEPVDPLARYEGLLPERVGS